MPDIFLVSAPSGGGKGTHCRLLLSHLKMHFSVSDTTRVPRSEDVDGETYNFIDKPEFRKRIAKGYYAEWAEVYGDYYGTPKHELIDPLKRGENVLLEIEIYGARQIRAIEDPMIKEALCTIFIVPPHKMILKDRLLERSSKDGTSPEKVERRLARFDEEVEERLHYDYVVVNGKLETAFRDLFLIVTNRIALSLRH